MPSKANSVLLVRNFKPCIGFTGRPAPTAPLQDRQILGGIFYWTCRSYRTYLRYERYNICGFDRGRMAHQPFRFGGSTALYPFTAGKSDFIAISLVRLTGFKDKSRLPLQSYPEGLYQKKLNHPCNLSHLIRSIWKKLAQTEIKIKPSLTPRFGKLREGFSKSTKHFTFRTSFELEQIICFYRWDFQVFYREK